MAEYELGRIRRVDLRDVWKHEALDFTPWVVQHVDMLSEALGLDLEIIGSEQPVGDFAVDILARDLGQNRRVVIENQLQDTDHSHLGQLITYAAGLQATVVVWISRHIREEHRQALDWLNRDGSSTEYFGVVVDLLQIDNSRPAVNFRVVATPHRWKPTKPTSTAEEPTGKAALYAQFFQSLIDDLRDNHRFTNARIGQPQNWYSFSARTNGFQYGFSFAAGARIRAEIYIDFGDTDKNLIAFDALYSRKADLEADFGETLEWERLEGKRACRIAIYRLGKIEDSTAALEEYHRWAIDNLLRFKRTFGPELPKAAASAGEIPYQNVAGA